MASDDAENKADAGSQSQPVTPKNYSEEEFKKVIAERDKAKERLRLIDEEARKKLEAEQIEKGEAKKILEAKEVELTELRKKNEEREAQEKALRESYINTLTNDADRMAAGFIPDLAKLKSFVDDKVKLGPPVDARSQVRTQSEADIFAEARAKNLTPSQLMENLRKAGFKV